MKREIRVTQDHIDRGGGTQPCFHCPIALAARDAGFQDVAVHHRYIHYASKGGDKFVRLPDEAMFFIQHFDKGWPVQPFSFEVDDREA